MTSTTRSFDLEVARAVELDGVRNWFIPDAKVLVIGGGSGFQAHLIASWGCAVMTVEIARPHGQVYRNSVLYDGVSLPVREHSMDLVFSSNVLEGVLWPRSWCRCSPEIRRALKPGGRVVCGLN